uniref:Uncharacterized protein n=1 Tax=Arundo donax TaxID=35708 RepID=A0A0A9AI16_ARUDO
MSRFRLGRHLIASCAFHGTNGSTGERSAWGDGGGQRCQGEGCGCCGTADYPPPAEDRTMQHGAQSSQSKLVGLQRNVRALQGRGGHGESILLVHGERFLPELIHLWLGRWVAWEQREKARRTGRWRLPATVMRPKEKGY